MIPIKHIKVGQSVFAGYYAQDAFISRVGNKNFDVSNYYGDDRSSVQRHGTYAISAGGGDNLWLTESDHNKYFKAKEAENANYAWAMAKWDDEVQEFRLDIGFCKVTTYEGFGAGFRQSAIVLGHSISVDKEVKGVYPIRLFQGFIAFYPMESGFKSEASRLALRMLTEKVEAHISHQITLLEGRLASIRSFTSRRRVKPSPDHQTQV